MAGPEASVVRSGRRVPMEVLCLGMPRTGTLSMRAALQELGYEGVYHMAAVMEEHPGHQAKWVKALEAKFEGKGKPFTKQQWDELLGDFMAVTDMPCMSFSPELIEHYPDAKVILLVRPVDTWHKSVMETIWKFPEKHMLPTSNPIRLILRAMTPSADFTDMLALCVKHCLTIDFPQNGRKIWAEHTTMIRDLVPQDRLLEMNIKEGWEPLCKFLDKPVPQTPFPRVNDTAEFQQKFGKGLFIMDVVAGLKFTAIVGALGVVGYGLQRYWTFAHH